MRLGVIYGAVATVAAATHDARGEALDSMCVVTNDSPGMLYEMPCGLSSLRGNGEVEAEVKRQVVYEVMNVASTLTASVESVSATDTTSASILITQRAAQSSVPATPTESSAASILASMVAATDLWPAGVHPFMAPLPTIPEASDCVDSLAEEFAMDIKHAVHTLGKVEAKVPVSNFGINLFNGTLIDTLNRLGSIVDNRQFQFDAFGQAGSIYTAGFQACGPPEARLLALGGNTIWWGCVSGSFMNLYDQNVAPQCVELTLPLLNNLEPGGDLHATANPTSTVAFEPVSISTTLSKNIPTAHIRRLEPSDGVAHDQPTFFREIPTTLTKTFAAKTIEMAVSTGEDDTLEQITVAASTVTQIIPARSDSSTLVEKEKRQGLVDTSGASATATTEFMFDPITATSIAVPVTPIVSQPVSVTLVFTTVTVTGGFESGTFAAITNTIGATKPPIEVVTTITDVQNGTTILTQTHSTQIVTLPQASTAFITADTARLTSTFANATTQVIVTSYATAHLTNGTIPSTTISSYLNVSNPDATSLSHTHPPSTLLSISTTTSEISTTTEAIASGSILGGAPAASTTRAISAASSNKKDGRNVLGVCSSIMAGLIIFYFLEKVYPSRGPYFGPNGK